MKKKPYSLWKRHMKAGGHIYYVRFRLDDGSWSTAKSSGESTKTAAEAWAIDYLRSGQVVLKENVYFRDFAKNFFDFNGPYIKSLKLRGKSIGRRHAENQNAGIENHLIPEFGDLKLSRIDSEGIEEFTHDLLSRGKSTATVNHILLSLRIILQYAHKKKYIQHMPIIEMVPNRHKERGILTPEEVKKFFSQEWTDKRYYVINLLAATTGLRMGEIRALQRKSVFEDYLEVSHSWEKGHGLKRTKTGRSRYVPLPSRTRQALAEVMDFTPYKEPEDFIFTGRKREAPLDHRVIERNFHLALKNIGIDEENRKKRRICFHSWRHYYNSLLINNSIPILKVQKLTGHSTQKMTENYYHTDDFKDVLKITGEIG